MFALARSIKNKVVVPLMGAFLLAFIMAFSVIQALNEMSASSSQLTKRTSTSSRTHAPKPKFKPSSSSAPKHESSRYTTRSYVPVSPKGQAINEWFFSSSPARSHSSKKNVNKKPFGSKLGRERAEMGGARNASRGVVRSISSSSFSSSDSSLPSSADSDDTSRSPSPTPSPAAARQVRARRLTMRDGRAVEIDIY